MDWTATITIVLGSSVLGALLTNAVSWLTRKRDRSRRNGYLALTLAHSFEMYASACLDSISDHDAYYDSEGSAGKPVGKPPSAFSLPDESFRDFDLKLLDSVLAFPQIVIFATDEVLFTADVCGPEEAQEICYKNTVELANQAISIADKLRSFYRLSPRDLKFGEFDLRKALRNKLLGVTH